MVPTAFQHQDVVTQVFLVPTKYHQNKALYIYIYSLGWPQQYAQKCLWQTHAKSKLSD